MGVAVIVYRAENEARLNRMVYNKSSALERGAEK